MQFVPLHVSCPVRRLASSGGGGGGCPVHFPPVPGPRLCAPSWAGLCILIGPAPGSGGGWGSLCAALPRGRGLGGAEGPSAPVPPAALMPRGRGRAGRCRAVGGPAGRGAGGAGGGSGPPCPGPCCRLTRGGDGRGVLASAGYRGGCTAPPARPAAGVPRPPSVALRPFLPPLPPCPVLPAPGGPRHPSRPCPSVPSLLLAPGSGAIPPLCPLARVAGPDLCHPCLCLFR